MRVKLRFHLFVTIILNCIKKWCEMCVKLVERNGNSDIVPLTINETKKKCYLSYNFNVMCKASSHH